MTSIQEGRFTAQLDDSGAVVFLIGMRFNSLRRVDQWWPTATAMPKMLRHLESQPEVGLLGWHQWFGRTTVLLSYWRSAEDLQRFASDPGAPHASAWRAYQRRVRKASVGIWHETYVVRPGQHEAIYVDMPKFGLAGATRSVPVGDGMRTAKQRLSHAP
ncbi:MAG: DUF4188 domain-containing protein [Mycobacteriaceae bacterium]